MALRIFHYLAPYQGQVQKNRNEGLAPPQIWAHYVDKWPFKLLACGYAVWLAVALSRRPAVSLSALLVFLLHLHVDLIYESQPHHQSVRLLANGVLTPGYTIDTHPIGVAVAVAVALTHIDSEDTHAAQLSRMPATRCCFIYQHSSRIVLNAINSVKHVFHKYYERFTLSYLITCLSTLTLTDKFVLLKTVGTKNEQVF